LCDKSAKEIDEQIIHFKLNFSKQMLPNLGRLSLQQADTRVVFTYNDTEKWDGAYRQKFWENECSICHDNFKKGDEIIVLKCGHVFHEGCMRRWDQNKPNCPLCRKRVVPKDFSIIQEPPYEDFFRNAAWEGDLAKVVQMLQDGIDVNAQDEDGITALMKACRKNHANVALVLLERPDIKVNLANNSGTTALSLASAFGLPGVVKKLFEKGANVNAQGKYGYTALMRALRNEHADVALMLLEHPDIKVDLANEFGDAALHDASENGMTEVVKKLIAKDADVNGQNKNGQTALIVACHNQHWDVVLTLLEDDNINVKLANKAGHTALHWASGHGMLAVVEKLIEKGADVNFQNNDGGTALFWASYKGRLPVVKKLIEKGADVNIQIYDRTTALFTACIQNHADVALTLLEHPDIRVDFVTSSGYTALHWASIYGMLAVVKKLIEKGIDVNIQNQNGDTALIAACHDGHTDVALALLEVDNINVDLVDMIDNAAWDWANENDMTEVVERIEEIQSRRASDDAAPMEVDVVSPDDRRDRSAEGRSVRPRIQATAAARLRARMQKLV